jgi:hypothetical protein
LLAARSLIALAYGLSLLHCSQRWHPDCCFLQLNRLRVPAGSHACENHGHRWNARDGRQHNNRSFALNEEIDLVVRDAGIARQLETSFAEDLKHSTEVTYEAWQSRSLSEKILELFTLPIEEEL